MDSDYTGADWLIERIQAMDDHIERIAPVAFNEANRYMPQGTTPRPGYIRYDLFPFLREPIECFDPLSPVREVNFKKGVQVGFTTLLESILLYVMASVKTAPAMFLTADKELAKGRIENYILPMINESGFSDIIRSADAGNTRKTGKTKEFIQWEGGGFLIYNGALNAAKMRMYSAMYMFKDELDGWKYDTGTDGNSDELTDDRLSAYWEVRKILRGSTPALEPSMINDAYNKGDKRKYMVLCKSCSFPQEIRQEHINKETGEVNGFAWETQDGMLILESVHYRCQDCGHKHFEHDKERLFATEHGAHWKPTATPKQPGIRSYHLPAWYSPVGFRPWSKGIANYLNCYDPVTKTIKNISQYQVYYNNQLGESFKVRGQKVSFMAVSAHRRSCYALGQIPNKYAIEHSGSKILFLTCQVDVHMRFLAVTVKGVTRGQCSYVIEYLQFDRDGEKDDCGEITSPVWSKLKELIEEKRYKADDGTEYGIMMTLVDAGYANATVCSFCGEYARNVYPILGRDSPGKKNRVKEFTDFTTNIGTIGYMITVDHYKDRLAPVLRREWSEEAGQQKDYHFNAPVDLEDKRLKELTVETRREKTDDRGVVTYEWYRPGNARNELWDLLVYHHAAVEIFAWSICIQHFELKNVDWNQFWDYAEADENNALFCRS